MKIVFWLINFAYIFALLPFSIAGAILYLMVMTPYTAFVRGWNLARIATKLQETASTKGENK